MNKYKTTKYFKIVKEQKREHDKCTDNNKKLVDHNHKTGEFISTISYSGNLKYQYKKFTNF